MMVLVGLVDDCGHSDDSGGGGGDNVDGSGSGCVDGIGGVI